MEWNIKTFIGMLQQYYGKLQPIHAGALQDWLTEKQFSKHYLQKLYQEITGSYSTKYGKPCDLAVVKETHNSLIPSYVPPAAILEHNRNLLEERVVGHDEGEELIRGIVSKLAARRRVASRHRRV